jgi:hypothetical protein
MAKPSKVASDAFDVSIEVDGELLRGPWRTPRQMLSSQRYENHASIHDDEMARKLGFQGGTIEGPTHFSQFTPLGYSLWQRRWMEQGCLSVHYQAPVYEGECVRACVRKRPDDETITDIWLEKEGGGEILQGTMSVGPAKGRSYLEGRQANSKSLTEPVILQGLRLGDRSRRRSVSMGMHQRMGDLYPFTLAEKLRHITEPSSWYNNTTANDSPFGAPIIPFEMISVLLNYNSGAPFYKKGPVVGLFADQEIKLMDGPLFVDRRYETDKEIVGFSESRRTESIWELTRLYEPRTGKILATMLLNTAILKESYSGYEVEWHRLYGPLGTT